MNRRRCVCVCVCGAQGDWGSAFVGLLSRAFSVRFSLLSCLFLLGRPVCQRVCLFCSFSLSFSLSESSVQVVIACSTAPLLLGGFPFLSWSPAPPTSTCPVIRIQKDKTRRRTRARWRNAASECTGGGGKRDKPRKPLPPSPHLVLLRSRTHAHTNTHTLFAAPVLSSLLFSLLQDVVQSGKSRTQPLRSGG